MRPETYSATGADIPSRFPYPRLIETVLTAARAQDLQRQLSGLTGGEGMLDSSFAGYQPLDGDPVSRQITGMK